jgi:hypothetical protein
LEHMKEVNEKLDRLYTPSRPTKRISSEAAKAAAVRLSSARTR